MAKDTLLSRSGSWERGKEVFGNPEDTRHYYPHFKREENEAWSSWVDLPWEHMKRRAPKSWLFSLNIGYFYHKIPLSLPKMISVNDHKYFLRFPTCLFQQTIVLILSWKTLLRGTYILMYTTHPDIFENILSISSWRL